MDDFAMLIAAREPDVMLLTEVIPKAQKHSIQETQEKLKGYDIYTTFNDTDGNLSASGIRGVAIFVKENIKCVEIKLKNEYADQVWVELGLRNKDHLLCGCIYRSPTREGFSTIETRTEVCETINEAVQRKSSHLLICGDFNYPDIDWECKFFDEISNIKRQFLDTIQDCQFYQHIFEPTRYRNEDTPGLLDLVFTNEESMIKYLSYNTGLL